MISESTVQSKLKWLVLKLWEICVTIFALEQIIFEGESQHLLWPLGILSAVAIYLFAHGRMRPDAPRLVFYLIVVGLALLSLLIASDLRAYDWLYNEPMALLSLAQLGASVAMVGVLIALGRRQVVAGWCALSLIWGLLVIAAITFANTSLRWRSHAFLIWESHELGIVVAFSLIAARILLADRTKSPSVGINKTVERCLWAGVAVALVCIGLALVPLVREPLSSFDAYRYTVAKPMLTQLLVSEDPIFAYHHGVDFKRQRDALRELIEHGEYRRGGSTIAMQLAKIRYLTPERSLWRKFKQLVLGVALELIYGKERVLWEYLDRVPFAPGVIGVNQAAKHFFNIGPDKLSTAQALILVLSIYNPTAYNPSIREVPPEVRTRALVISSRNQAQVNNLLTQISSFPFAS